MIKNCDTIYHCLQKFTRQEVLDEGNKYKCEKCKVTTRATKQFTIHRAPNVLSICLKRFSMMGRNRFRDFLLFGPGNFKIDILDFQAVGLKLWSLCVGENLRGQKIETLKVN